MKQGTKKSRTASKKSKSGRKQASKTSKSGAAKTVDQGFEPEGPQLPPTVRFSATIHAREHIADATWIERLAIDRVPDPSGLVRALVTLDDCVRLVNQGFEVRLQGAYPVQPLSASLVESDESFKAWLDERVQTVKALTPRKGSKRR